MSSSGSGRLGFLNVYDRGASKRPLALSEVCIQISVRCSLGVCPKNVYKYRTRLLITGPDRKVAPELTGPNGQRRKRWRIHICPDYRRRRLRQRPASGNTTALTAMSQALAADAARAARGLVRELGDALG